MRTQRTRYTLERINAAEHHYAEVRRMDSPVAVKGVEVGRMFDTLHAILVTGWTMPDGSRIADIVLHYADGTKVKLPMKLGHHLGSWWDSPRMFSNGKPAWIGKNPIRNPITVFAAQWKNPHPEKKVDTLDIVSAVTNCPPGIIAMTAGSDVR